MSRKQDSGQCTCGGCKAKFRTLAAFDKHRIGPYSWTGRRCLSTDEMLTAGMAQDSAGRWREPLRASRGTNANPWQKARKTAPPAL